MSVSYLYELRSGPILLCEVSNSLRFVVAKRRLNGAETFTVTTIHLPTFTEPMTFPLDFLKPRIRISAGSFDRDAAMEVLVACVNGNQGTKNLWLVEIDRSYDCTIVASLTNLSLDDFDVRAGTSSAV